MENQEKKNSRIALILSVSVHAIIALIAVFFIGCWKAPGPPWPNPVVGIEIDMGLDAIGSGEVKTDAPASEENLETEEAQPEDNETTEDVVEPTESEVTPTESTPADQTSDMNASDVHSDHHEDVSTPTPVAEPTPTPVEPVTEPKPAVTPATTPPTTEPKDIVPITGGSNNGDNIDEVGDKGSESSTTPSDTYSGDQKPGGGEDGLSLSISGWKNNNKPSEKRITHSGEIVFSFVVDEYGEIRSHKIISSSFTPAENQLLVEKLYTVTFTQTTTGRAPDNTEGKLVWKFRAK